MNKLESHTFHIPVMGLGYTIDTPVKVARFGISSVMSIIEDNLVEKMREFYCAQEKAEYIPIEEKDVDHRAKRTTAYLNLLDGIVKKQIQTLKTQSFEKKNDIVKYFELLPSNSPARALYKKMLATEDEKEKSAMQEELRGMIIPGSIDVNIMTKCDRMNYAENGELLPVEYADAMAALRGFAKSNLSSSVVFSAGMNPRLYSYCESFNDFFPDETGYLKKKIILKVSDYRSALVQGKFLAKKGLWVSEFRVESGLNCGGHAFATDGMLMGPILEEFKNKKAELIAELFEICNNALIAKGRGIFLQPSSLKITAQGGIGTSNENDFLFNYYNVDGTGWGSPFLLVPEATNVDDETLQQLISAKKEDYFLSYEASPLGVPFNNFRKSSSEKQRIERIEKGRPGSPCSLKFLSFNTEFTTKPICTASRQYEDLKIKQLEEQDLSPEEFKREFEKITGKDCLCEGLGMAALIKNNIIRSKQHKAVAICPGPNLAYFSDIFSLQEMVDHIYGRTNLLNSLERPNMFINELILYIDYLKKEIEKNFETISAQKNKSLNTFKANLLEGINYYKELIPSMKNETERYCAIMKDTLNSVDLVIRNLLVPEYESRVNQV